jgi:sortase, srtB family
MKGRTMRKKCIAITACLLMAVFLYAAYHVWVQGREYLQSSTAYTKLDEFVSISPTAAGFATPSAIPPSAAMPSPAPMPLPEKEYDYPGIIWPEVDFERLREINPEIVGWLVLEGSEINYPVAQAEDNAKYLNYLFDGTKNKAGCPFLDAENAGDFSDWHSIIYAHNRKDGSMFGGLSKFKEQSYYDEHPRFLLITETARYVVEIFSGHVARSDSGAWKVVFQDEDEFDAWREVIKERSSIETEVVPGQGERILTLSTCSYEFDNARYVLHGVLRKARMPGESTE